MDTGQLPTRKPCSETSPNVTWDIENRPSGYWTPGNSWTSLICQKPNVTSQWAISCLQNTSIWVFGDSNGVEISDAISALIKAKTVKSGKWPYQFIKKNTNNSITVTFTPLEYPVYLRQAWRPRLFYGGVAKQIDSIPATGAHILIVHYFLHIMPSHLNVASLRLKAVHEAIQRLINRNPNVLVGIRGPHVSSVEYNFNHAVGGDVLGIHFIEMIRYVFADFKHKVIFLDGWEMTIALENALYHPVDTVPFEMVRTLLAFKCP